MAIGDARFSPKTDNNPQAKRAKIDIRRRVLDAIRYPEQPVTKELAAKVEPRRVAVFDAFAGAGQMYSEVWKAADAYTGCDLKWNDDGRRMFAANNTRVMRVIDLKPFNVFDLDAYGSPWEQAIILADRRRVGAGELLGLVLTEGAGLSYKANVVPIAIQELTGRRVGIVGLAHKQDAVIDRAITGLAARMSCTIARRWQAEGRTGASMRYIGLVLRGR